MSSKSKKSASGGSKAIGAIPKVDCNKDPNAPKQLPTAYQTKTAGLDPAVQGNLRVLLQDTNISLSDLDSLGKAVTINTEYLESNDETLRFDPLAADGASLSQSKMKNRVEKEDKDPDIVYSEIMTEIAPTLTKKRSDTIQLPKTTVIKDVDRRIPIKACPTTPRKKVVEVHWHQSPEGERIMAFDPRSTPRSEWRLLAGVFGQVLRAFSNFFHKLVAKDSLKRFGCFSGGSSDS